jgi:hypothetical protein
MTAKHTPVPWQYTTNVGPTRALIVEPDGSTIVELSTNVGHRGTFAANTALIVTAVNSHAVLVEALRQTAYELAVLVGKDHSTVQQAREALRKAGE